MATGDQVFLKNNLCTVTYDKKGKKKSNKRFVVFGRSRNGTEYFFRVYKDDSEKVLKDQLSTKPDQFCGTGYGQFTETKGSIFKKNIQMSYLTILDKNGFLRFEEVGKGSTESPMKESLGHWNDRIRKEFECRWEYEVKTNDKAQDTLLMNCTASTLSITSKKSFECLHQWPIIGCQCRSEEDSICLKFSQDDSQEKEHIFLCKNSKDIVIRIKELAIKRDIDSDSDDEKDTHIDISTLTAPSLLPVTPSPKPVVNRVKTVDRLSEENKKKRCTPPTSPVEHLEVKKNPEKHKIQGKKKSETNNVTNKNFNFEIDLYSTPKPSQRCSIMRRYGSDCMLDARESEEETMDQEDYLDMSKNTLYHRGPDASKPVRKSRKSLIRREIKVKSVAPLDLEMIVPIHPRKNDKSKGYYNLQNDPDNTCRKHDSKGYINLQNDPDNTFRKHDSKGYLNLQSLQSGLYDSVPSEKPYVNIVDQVGQDGGERKSTDLLYSSIDNTESDDSIFDVNILASSFYDYENKEEIYKLIRMREKRAPQYVNTLPRAGWGYQASRDSGDYTIVRRSGKNQFKKKPIPQPRKPIKTKARQIVKQANIDEVENEDEIDESAWSDNICFTLESILKRRPPVPDTLGLTRPTRVMLCYSLYTISPINPSSSSWHDLADAIGLSHEASDIITNFIFQHPSVEVAAEIVLRHWQFSYNRYGVGVACLEPCTPEGLKKILSEKMKRYDLLELLPNT